MHKNRNIIETNETKMYSNAQNKFFNAHLDHVLPPPVLQVRAVKLPAFTGYFTC